VLASFHADEVSEAKNGQEALEFLAGSQPDIVLADWEMEPIDGLEFVKRVRASDNDAIRTLPIIMLSSHSEVDRVAAARDAGINEFVAKPFSAGALLGRIEAAIDRPRQFINSNDFFGPERRRREASHEHGERRGSGGDDS
jgi:DNA-binding response OmpR family regulator